MRLIDVDAFKAHWNKEYRMLHPKDIFIVALSNFPTIEAEPVRHGRWEFEKDLEDFRDVKCTACGGTLLTEWSTELSEYRYCPNCGAKMDKENDE